MNGPALPAARRGALSGGALLGGVAALPLWALEMAWLLRAGTFASAGEALQFALFDLGLLLLSGTTLGALQGVLVRLVSAVARRLAGERGRSAAWEVVLYALASVPPAAYLAARMFAGRRAQAMPGHHLIAVGAGLAAVVCTAMGARVAVAARSRVPRLRGVVAAALVAALLCAACALAWADRVVLVRLYGPMHVALAGGALVLAEFAAAVAGARLHADRRTLPITLLLVLAGPCATATGLDSERFRAVALDRASLGGKVLAALPDAGPRDAAVVPPPPASLPQVQGPRLPARDIVLVTVDALRADRLGAWGYRRGITPNLDRLAAESIVFTRAYCQIPHTSFSIATLLTGQYVRTRATLGLPTRVETIAEVLRRFGYKTAGFFPPAVFFIDHDRFREFEESRYGVDYVKYEYLDGPGRTDQVLAFLAAQQAPRLFLWAHYFEPHEPYSRQPGFDFGASASDRYDGEVAATDREIGRLLAAVDRLRPGAIVAVTADHGEEFGDHGGHYHGTTLFDEQARVPLLLRVPGVPARRVDGPVGIVDLCPTLLSLVDVPPPAAMTGTDLGPWIAGADPERLPAAFSEVLSRKMAARGHDKLIVDYSTRVAELYDLRADPGERRNLADTDPRRVAELRGEIDRRLAVIAGLDPRAAHEAALARARAGDPAALPDVLEALRDGDVEARREAAGLLFAVAAEPARVDLERYLDDADPEVAHRVALAAARLGVPRAVERARRLLERPDLPAAMRRQAALALAERGLLDGFDVLLSTAAAAERFEDRQAATVALGSLHDRRATPTLIKLLLDVRLRRFAVGALGELHDARALAPLLDLCEHDRFISVREAAARALGDIGDPACAPRLRAQLMREPERPVVAEMLATLARLHALPRGERDGGDLWLVLQAERAGAVRVSAGGVDLAVLEARAGLGAYPLEGATPASPLSVAGARLVSTWARPKPR
jgi:HEAT repeat protein